MTPGRPPAGVAALRPAQTLASNVRSRYRHAMVEQIPLGIDTPTRDPDAMAADLEAAGRPINTRDAYKRSWTDFSGWCKEHSRKALPTHPDTVRAYLADRWNRAEGATVSTLKQRKAAIRDMHRRRRYPDPTQDEAVRRLWVGILAEDRRPRERKLAILEGGMRAIIKAMDHEIQEAGRFPDPYLRAVNARDRAMVLSFYWGALRRGEIASLDAEQIVPVAGGVKLAVNASDLATRHRDVTLQYGADPSTCPVIALQNWLRMSGIERGRVFLLVRPGGTIEPTPLAPRTIVGIIQRRCALAGIDPETCSPHSLRLGALLSAAYRGESDDQILKRGGLHGERTKHDLAPALQRARTLRRAGMRPPATLLP